jgi:hypothetical protein
MRGAGQAGEAIRFLLDLESISVARRERRHDNQNNRRDEGRTQQQDDPLPEARENAKSHRVRA